MNHLGTVKLNTERLILRKIKKQDTLGIYNSYINDKEFLYYANKERMSLSELTLLLQSIEEKYKNKDYYNWLITLKNKEIIGSINLHIDNTNDSVLINYAIDNRHYNNGYMTEALSIVKDYLLNNLKATKIIGGVEINNIASIKVLEKCGFKFEEIRKNSLMLNDGLHDLKIYSIINE